MDKAQAVRKRRLSSINATEEEAKKVFSWILDLFDERTTNKDYSPMRVHTDGTFIFADQRTYKDGLECGCCKALFDELKNLINNEEGFSANYGYLSLDVSIDH